MSPEELKNLVRQAIEDTNAAIGDAAKMRAWYDKYVSPNLVHHDLARGNMNREQRIQVAIAAFASFPDGRYTIEDIVAETDKTATRYSFRGTHKGTYMGVAGTGKQLVLRGVNIYRFADGKLVEAWDYPDALGLMAQLGLRPAPAPK